MYATGETQGLELEQLIQFVSFLISKGTFKDEEQKHLFAFTCNADRRDDSKFQELRIAKILESIAYLQTVLELSEAALQSSDKSLIDESRLAQIDHSLFEYILLQGINKISKMFVKQNERYSINFNLQLMRSNLLLAPDSTRSQGVQTLFSTSLKIIKNYEQHFKNGILAICEAIDQEISKINTPDKFTFTFRFKNSASRTGDDPNGDLSNNPAFKYPIQRLTCFKNNKYVLLIPGASQLTVQIHKSAQSGPTNNLLFQRQLQIFDDLVNLE